ncbi:mannose-1-phosphate guanylyltransferase [Terribacillus saccharophilus]|uniref:sugar phosphate nucleotidyltransferase n=1 Tax=Terribacillus saccharophilus TaxID=361277 RepID=UPI000BA6209F|nr:sugar phosphate nucleotidyltransferase [Terribacillus saccharophilus]PAF37234.1 mannose-1-phosphate guanylyltransferase [Terribacillus saccharophilus]
MQLILLSGGSGKRLWPLSNDSRSKQFLKVLHNKNNDKESMIQRVCRQLKENNLLDKSIVSTSKGQVEIIKNQIGDDMPIVIEPSRRDTFPAIALSTSYLLSKSVINKEDVVIVLPVDAYVDNSFFKKVKELEKTLIESKADIALLGVTPSSPSEKFGYIVPEETIHSHYLHVDYFQEKPTKEVAKHLIEKNALWNCGVFCFKAEYLIKLLTQNGYSYEYDDLFNFYNDLSKNSFDYEVVEKTKNIVVLPYDGSWKDLGTWNSLTDEMNYSLTGKGIISEDSIGSKVINELDIPITLIGIENAIVAASPDGILVTNREASPTIKEYIGEFNNRPMYEERRWGWYKVLEYVKYEEGNEVLTKRIGINAGSNLSYQLHFKRTETWTVLKGEGILLLEGKPFHLRIGDTITIPLGKKHALKAITVMEILEVQSGIELVEDDVHRISLNWEEIIAEHQLSS